MYQPINISTPAESAAFQTGSAALDALPKSILRVIIQSGVFKDGRSIDWLSDPRAQRALEQAHAAHGGKMRKQDPALSRTIHEVCVMHEAANDEALNDWLKKNGLDPMLGVIALALHDKIENLRKLAEEKKIKFKIEEARSEIGEFVEGAHNKRVLFSFMRYMTDGTGLHKADRYTQQLRKGFDAYGVRIANHLEQKGRIYDKTNHAELDAAACEKMGPQDALNAWVQAMLKVFALDVPVATDEHYRRYFAAADKLIAAVPGLNQHTEGQKIVLRSFFAGQPELLGSYNRVMAIVGRPEMIISAAAANDPHPATSLYPEAGRADTPAFGPGGGPVLHIVGSPAP